MHLSCILIVRIINNGICECCNLGSFETVRHFIIDCTKFDYHRHKFRKKLCKINAFFKQPINCNVLNILFPHYWQLRPNIKDVFYNDKLIANDKNRK